MWERRYVTFSPFPWGGIFPTKHSVWLMGTAIETQQTLWRLREAHAQVWQPSAEPFRDFDPLTGADLCRDLSNLVYLTFVIFFPHKTKEDKAKLSLKGLKAQKKRKPQKTTGRLKTKTITVSLTFILSVCFRLFLALLCRQQL